MGKGREQRASTSVNHPLNCVTIQCHSLITIINTIYTLPNPSLPTVKDEHTVTPFLPRSLHHLVAFFLFIRHVLQVWTSVTTDTCNAIILRQLLSHCPGLQNLLVRGAEALTDKLLQGLWQVSV